MRGLRRESCNVSWWACRMWTSLNADWRSVCPCRRLRRWPPLEINMKLGKWGRKEPVTNRLTPQGRGEHNWRCPSNSSHMGGSSDLRHLYSNKRAVSVVIGYVPSGVCVPSPPYIEFLIHQIPRSLW